MTVIEVRLDEALARRLADRAATVGVSVEELARRALLDVVTVPGDHDDLEFIGAGESETLRGATVDDLLDEGFGR